MLQIVRYNGVSLIYLIAFFLKRRLPVKCIENMRKENQHGILQCLNIVNWNQWRGLKGIDETMISKLYYFLDRRELLLCVVLSKPHFQNHLSKSVSWNLDLMKQRFYCCFCAIDV